MNKILIALTFLITGSVYASAVYRAGVSVTIPGSNVGPASAGWVRYHDAAAVNINNNTGAWVDLGGATTIPSGVKIVVMTSTIGEPLEIGEDTVACDTATVRRYVANRGDGPLTLTIALTSGSKLCVRSLTTSAVTSGELTLNMAGN